jgi:hypothetical protein
MKRTQDEIVARMLAKQDEDFLGAIAGDLVPHLDLEHARPFLKEGTTEWHPEVGVPRQEILEYLPFAWGKANDCRGISAGRSIQHLESWTWLDGKDLDFKAYSHYGKGLLVMVSEEYGFDWRSEDDNQWSNYEDGPFQTADEVLMS